MDGLPSSQFVASKDSTQAEFCLVLVTDYTLYKGQISHKANNMNVRHTQSPSNKPIRLKSAALRKIRLSESSIKGFVKGIDNASA